jgi:hypothetical protein
MFLRMRSGNRRILRGALVLGLASACVVACAANAPLEAVVKGPPSLAAVGTVDASTLQVRRCGDLSRGGAALANADAGAPSSESEADYVPQETSTKTHKGQDLCETADDNLARATREIMAGVGQLPKGAQRPWDRKTPPQYLRSIDARLSLTSPEKAKLAANGFVVLPRTAQASYGWAMHEVHQSELPVFVSMDAILFAIFSSNDKLIAALEQRSLAPKLDAALTTMHCALAEHHTRYPAEVAADVDLYLTVARSLLAAHAVPSVLGVDEEAAKLTAMATKAQRPEILDVFGRSRYVDFSQYVPRGHYAQLPTSYPGEEAQASPLAAYFRAGMWLSRMELNIASRGSRSSDPGAGPNPAETPREANVALALADLVRASGAANDLRQVTSAWTVLAGRREDLSADDLGALVRKGHIDRIDDASPAALRIALGDSFQRTARFHRMPEGTRTLPAIFTLLGPRVTPDAPAFMPLVNGQVPGRYMVSAGDVGAMMGLDSAREYLAADIAKYPELGPGLLRAKKIVASADDDKSLYYAWFSAVRSLAEPPAESAPSFMRTPAYADFALGGIAAGYGEIRHNYVLMAGQAYDEGGCDIPDGYVEPRPKTLDALIGYAERGALVSRELDPEDHTYARSYFKNLGTTLGVLRRIVEDEVEGRPLSVAEKRFLSMVVEMTPGSTGNSPTYTGFYFDMFRTRENEALTSPAFIADYYTSSEQGRIAYLGVSAPVMGVFVVDRGGGPRAFVGPVARAFQAESSIENRLSDQTADKADARSAPWERRTTVPALAPVKFLMEATLGDFEHENLKATAWVRTEQSQRVTVTLLDHHRRVLRQLTQTVPAGKRVNYKFDVRGDSVEGVRATIGELTAEGFTSLMNKTVTLSGGGMEFPADDAAGK